MIAITIYKNVQCSAAAEKSSIRETLLDFGRKWGLGN